MLSPFRGVVPLQVLKLLEAETGKRTHQLFDYICGVSTGAERRSDPRLPQVSQTPAPPSCPCSCSRSRPCFREGAVLAFMLGLAHFSLEDCAEMYRRFGSEVFRQNPLVGTVKMGWNHSYYDTQTWEAILR